MADTKLSNLTELAAAPATNDEIYIRDVSEVAASESKKITISNLFTSPTINGTIATTGLTLPAVTLGGAVTMNGQAFDAGAGSMQMNTSNYDQGFIIQSSHVDHGGGTIYKKTASISTIGSTLAVPYRIEGKDADAANQVWIKHLCSLNNVTSGSETCSLYWDMVSGGNYTLNRAMTLSGAGALWLDADVSFGTSIDSAAVADEVSIGGYEISAGHRALAISSEEVVVTEIDETKFSHKLPVRINGATYNIMLTTT